MTTGRVLLALLALLLPAHPAAAAQDTGRAEQRGDRICVVRGTDDGTRTICWDEGRSAVSIEVSDPGSGGPALSSLVVERVAPASGATCHAGFGVRLGVRLCDDQAPDQDPLCLYERDLAAGVVRVDCRTRAGEIRSEELPGDAWPVGEP